MRKLIVLFALLCATIGIGAIPSTASAADCSVTSTPIFYNGSKLQFSKNISNCYDVDVVEFAPNAGSFSAGINNNSNGVFHFWAPPTLLDVLCGRYNYWFSGTCSHVIFVSLWGCGPVPQNLSGYGVYRIHGYTSHNWGPWHSSPGPAQTMNC